MNEYRASVVRSPNFSEEKSRFFLLNVKSSNFLKKLGQHRVDKKQSKIRIYLTCEMLVYQEGPKENYLAGDYQRFCVMHTSLSNKNLI